MPRLSWEELFASLAAGTDSGLSWIGLSEVNPLAQIQKVRAAAGQGEVCVRAARKT